MFHIAEISSDVAASALVGATNVFEYPDFASRTKWTYERSITRARPIDREEEKERSISERPSQSRALGEPNEESHVDGLEHSPALRSPLSELELGLLDALLLSSELNYFGSDAFDQMEGWMLAFSDFVRSFLIYLFAMA
ncbi:hypothetical protein RND71_031988 [Anisodus tanguticus]|uniref:Uncharacterized protein n=1 Tax=Anisodus tanguticus TaxID=243964 RepID=A0AAE1RDP0_9SOLA|nr:hypothetical protein RND71_031988 [Anisodus tanguticus]